MIRDSRLLPRGRLRSAGCDTEGLLSQQQQRRRRRRDLAQQGHRGPNPAGGSGPLVSSRVPRFEASLSLSFRMSCD